MDSSSTYNVSFIPYFHLLVFGSLVTLVAWFSFRFCPSCPSCLVKCKQRLCNIFMFFQFHHKKWQKTKKTKMRWIPIEIYHWVPFSFRHKRQSWWSPLHAQVGICPIGEADFCTTKRRHLPLHELRGDQRSKGCIIPVNCLLSDIFHSSWFFLH